ncbi:hypothetical protein EJ04DRAFT_521913 [Polyplosphaeria fusca]|uniref:Transposase n=1 Tax=Polyplosphaeria fusca TaxID=682080 RepID=A0A9P4R465_9PLEO|nr:hypothetical protein EJ04DRAFT_521913 [Polyplosphaeria fusca]
MSTSRQAPRAPVGTHIPPPRVYARPRVPQTSRHGQLTSGKRARTYQFLRHGLVFKKVSRHAGVSRDMPYRIHNNIMTYGAMLPPRRRVLGRPQKLTPADKEALYNELLQYGWMNQAEMVWWLEQERDVVVSQSTISRFLRSERINRKVMRLTSLNRDEDLRDDYRRIISRYIADELVFIDESFFKEKDSWRYRAYGPIGSEDR